MHNLVFQLGFLTRKFQVPKKNTSDSIKNNYSIKECASQYALHIIVIQGYAAQVKKSTNNKNTGEGKDVFRILSSICDRTFCF